MNHWLFLVQICLLAKFCFAQTNVTGSVKDESGAAIKTGTVTAVRSGGEDRQIAAVKDGRYQFTALANGAYDFRFEAPGFDPKTETKISLSGTSIQLDELLAAQSDPVVRQEESWTNILWVIGALLAYFTSIVVTRWYKIAKPSRNFLLSQIGSLGNQLQCNRAQNPHRIDDLQSQLNDLRIVIESPRRMELFKQFLFWSQSMENASWITVHEIERELAAYLSPIEAVSTNLLVAASRLKAIGSDPAKEIAKAIDTELGQKKPNHKLRIQLLALATGMVYTDRDENFTTLMDWQNKAMWLILLSSVLLMVLAVAAGNPALFLAGACGGLLSRLMRTLQSTSTPMDYGASWSTLFLSPIFGAFSGWFGIGLIVLLTNPSVGLLGKAFSLVNWGHPLRLSTLTLAFLCGFSERFFNSLVEVMEKQTSAADAANTGTNTTTNTTTTTGPPGANDNQPASAQAGNDVPADNAYNAAKAKVASWIASGTEQDKAKAVAFLVAMGQEAGVESAASVLSLVAAKVEGLVGDDASRQTRYVLEAGRADQGEGNGH